MPVQPHWVEGEAQPKHSDRRQVFRNGRSAGQFGALDDLRQSCHRSLTTGTM